MSNTSFMLGLIEGLKLSTLVIAVNLWFVYLLSYRSSENLVEDAFQIKWRRFAWLGVAAGISILIAADIINWQRLGLLGLKQWVYLSGQFSLLVGLIGAKAKMYQEPRKRIVDAVSTGAIPIFVILLAIGGI